MKIIIKENREKLIEALLNSIQVISHEAISKNNIFHIGLSGGSLGSFLVPGLLNINTDFSKWKLYFCDERIVPENSSDSTYGFYKNTLVGDKLKDEQFIKIKQGLSAEETAENYAEQILKNFPEGNIPRFDLLLLGMGPDGHTCSLFPHHKLLEENEKIIAPIVDSPKPPPERITMTLKVLNNAKNCIFALSGKEKASMVKKILINNENLPAGRVKPTNGEVYWILDKDAAVEM